MAEIFETGSAVLGVAVVAIKLSTLIVEIADATRTIRTSMLNDALPFRSFRDLIETAEYSIKFRLPAAGTDLVAYMHDRNIFECIEEQAKALYDDIAVQLKKIQLLRQKHAHKDSSYPNRFYAAWRWEKIRKPKLEDLHPRMEQLKSTIQLVLGIIQLEVMARSGEASRSHGRSEEIAKLRDLIGKKIEAIEQLRTEFPSVAQFRIGNRTVDSAAEICYLASTVSNTGTVPQLARQVSPPPVSESTRALSETPNFDSWPRGTLSPATCPRCYQVTTPPPPLEVTGPSRPSRERSTSRQRLRRPPANSRPTRPGDSVQPLPDGTSRPDGHLYVPRPPRSHQTTQAKPASETIRVIPAPGAILDAAPCADTAPEPKPKPEPEPEAEPTNPDIIIIEPPPAQDTLPEWSPDAHSGPENEPPEPEATPNGAPTSSHPPSSSNNLHPSKPPPSHSRSPSLDAESDYDLEPVPSRATLNPAPAPSHSHHHSINRRRRPPTSPLPVITKDVAILNHNGQWHRMPVRLDTSLYVPNRHDNKGREIHYYGIISLGTLIDKLGWPEETLLEGPRFVEIPKEARYRWDSKRLEGVGRVTLTWRVDQQSEDEWENAVVPKMTRECIVTRQDPCEQGVVLKAMPAAQRTQL